MGHDKADAEFTRTLTLAVQSLLEQWSFTKPNYPALIADVGLEATG